MTAPELFAQYAYPPNALGYCGPADTADVLALAEDQVDGALFESTARCFEGTWPYFEFIAKRHGLSPLDERVVESYWLGGELTAAIDVAAEGQELLDALAAAGGSWARSPDTLLPGMDPDHNFHVFAVYPWLGLLARKVSDQPRLVLDRCRIRWGTVVALNSEEATVLSQALAWDGAQLSLGRPQEEKAVVAEGSIRLADTVRVGDQVALHWDWVCGCLRADQQVSLEESTQRHLDIANARLREGLV